MASWAGAGYIYIRLLADYAAPPDGALTWRFKSDLSGSGVLGDLASHGVDLGRHLVGEITDLLCDTATFITQRRQVDMTVSHFPGGREVRWELLRMRTTHGARGALSWDFRRMGELQLCLDQDYQNAYFSTHYVAPGDGDLARFQPAAGITMSFDDLKIVEANSLVQSIATGKAHGASVEDALYAAEIIEAMAESGRSRRWVTLPQ